MVDFGLHNEAHKRSGSLLGEMAAIKNEIEIKEVLNEYIE